MKLEVRHIINHLEKKFLVHYSPLRAERELHALKQGSLTFSQLQARIQKLARLSTRLEHMDQRDHLTRVKGVSSFLMSINTSDRLHIYNENARHSTHSLAPMNLDQMVHSLLQLAADKLSTIWSRFIGAKLWVLRLAFSS